MRLFRHHSMMVSRRLALALAVGLGTLLVSFLLINIGGTVWASYDSPHDGQGGIGFFLISLVASPVASLVAFAITFTRAGRQA